MFLLQTVFAFELLHPSGGINELLSSREKRMARAADLHYQVFFRASGFDLVSAGTSEDNLFKVFGVNFTFHFIVLFATSGGGLNLLRPAD